MTNLVLDATQYLLMAKVAARMGNILHRVFWQILPDIIPDLTAHLPALTAAVRAETEWYVLNELSSSPLPTTLSPQTISWRQGLIDLWKKQLNTAREALDKGNSDLKWQCRYTSSLRGLTQVDRCHLPPDMTCPSVLPTLLSEALAQRFKVFKQLEQLECLAALSDWHPGLNVLTDPTVLNEWGSFWLEVYHQGNMDTGEEKPDIQNIKKGIAAKALLNLMETGRKEETVIPPGMETILLESLATAVDVAGEIQGNHYSYNLGNSFHLKWLSWQPQDVTRFPTDKLPLFPKALLEKFKLLSPIPDSQWDEKLQLPFLNTLEQLVRCDQGGLLVSCGIDLLSEVVPHMSNYLDACLDNKVRNPEFLNHELRQWLVREKTVSVEGGKELLQKLESLWQSECKSERRIWYYPFRAWKGRVEMQQAGLATETPDALQKDMLKSIKKEPSPELRLALSLWISSLWSSEKDKPDRIRRACEQLWQKGLESDDKEIRGIAALSLLKPNPADDLAARRQRLWEVMHALPEKHCPSLSIAELAHLMETMEKLRLKNPNTDFNADTNRTWQFRSDETRFRVPTEHVAPVSTLLPVQTAHPDRVTQRIAGGKSHPGRYR